MFPQPEPQDQKVLKCSRFNWGLKLKECSEVGTAVDGSAGELLGRHVGGSAEQLAGGGELTGRELGDAEIGDARPLAAVDLARGHEDVGGLDVAMDDALAVRVTEGLGELLADIADAVEGEALTLLHGACRGFDPQQTP